MIKRFVLNYIRNYMSHEYMRERNEILQAVNEGCARAFSEDSIPGRISWVVGELVDNDPEFHERSAPMVMNAIAHEMLLRTNKKVSK